MIPVFGARREGLLYRPRPAAYAVIRDAEGRIALVRNGRGLFLPGGGREGSETAEENLLRELREECARVPTILRPLGEAMQFFVAGDGGYEMRAAFFEAALGDPLPHPPEHAILWLAPREADLAFYHRSHAWAVKEAFRP